MFQIVDPLGGIDNDREAIAEVKIERIVGIRHGVASGVSSYK
jgi:hypothetical protein